jgi:transglutaminase-like putative cysteine protease
MHFHVLHRSLYHYDIPVSLGTHVLRLTPRPSDVQLQWHRLDVQPQPTFRQQEIDTFGNSVLRVDFQGTTRQLCVESEFELDTLPPPSLFPLGTLLPSPQVIAHEAGARPHPDVERFAEILAAEAGHEPVAFLDHLADILCNRFTGHVRPSGDARAAHETLALGSGACRDLTVLFLEACASVGLRGRFVSGYQAFAQTPDGQRHLHAWAEVMLPGLGWRGWDAMHGIRVGDGHVALCAAPTQAGTMPIEGAYSFQGSVLNSTLDHVVQISVLPSGR